MQQKLFGRRTGMRVSELALGCGRLGAKGQTIDPAEAAAMLAAFADAGGTLIDTSSVHGGGRSEEMIGQFLAEAGRDRFVVSTKYGRPPGGDRRSLAGGAHRGAMLAQVEASLRRLGTDRIDLYTIEFPDSVTPIEEILRGMDALVRQGKVIAFALSNFAAWQVAQAVTLADLRGWAPVAAIHYQYNLLERRIEQEHLPMADALGLAVLAWSPQAAGALARTPLTGLPDALADLLAEVAAEHATEPGAVSVAWLLGKGVIPVLGARNIRQLRASLAAAVISLTPENVQHLDGTVSRSTYPADLMAQLREHVGIDDAMVRQAARGVSSQSPA